jgi:hypothetical protein
MLKVILILIMIIGFGGVILGILGMIYDYIQDKSISKIQTSQLSIPKSKFVHLVNEWCWENIKTNNPKPSISICYNKNKKKWGVYYSSSNSMVVYVNNTPQLVDIVSTTIHEYTHSTQKTKEFDKLYNQYTQEKGYWDNPFEIECRKVSEQYQYQCLKDLLTQYQILK